jgi:hypothetical protein
MLRGFNSEAIKIGNNTVGQNNVKIRRLKDSIEPERGVQFREWFLCDRKSF